MVVTNPVGHVRPALPAAIRQAWQFSPMLILFVGANVGFFAVSFAGLLTDPRLILGAPAWAKTLKFSMSFVIYGATLLWMLGYVKTRPRAARIVAFATGAILLAEMVLLALQAARGHAIHFNQSTLFDTLVWRLMSIGISIFYLFDIIGGVLIARETFVNPALGLGIKLGITMALIGFGLGFLMVVPNAAQLPILMRGGHLDYIGAHTVGALVDGQTGMIPILGWNMDGGDLRIPHFIGIHGAQFIPLVAGIAMLLGARGVDGKRGLSVTRQRALVVVGAAFYFGLTMLVLWQALRNESIVSPSAATLAVLAALGLVTLASATVVILFRRSHA